MSRIEVLKYDQMTPEQQTLHNEILSGPRSRIGGPMNAWFRSPELGSLYQKVGAFCRYHTTLEPKLSELAIIIVARHWDQPVEWRAHQPLALEAGLDPEIAEAIENHEKPKEMLKNKKSTLINAQLIGSLKIIFKPQVRGNKGRSQEHNPSQ